MNYLNIFNSIVISEYLIIAAVLLLLIDFFITLFALLIRSDAMYKNDGIQFVSNIVLVVLEIALIIASIIIFTHETLSILLAIPLVCTAVMMTSNLIIPRIFSGFLPSHPHC